MLKAVVAELGPACVAAGCQLDPLSASTSATKASAQAMPYIDVHSPALCGGAWLGPALLSVDEERASKHRLRPADETAHCSPGMPLTMPTGMVSCCFAWLRERQQQLQTWIDRERLQVALSSAEAWAPWAVWRVGGC